MIRVVPIAPGRSGRARDGLARWEDELVSDRLKGWGQGL